MKPADQKTVQVAFNSLISQLGWFAKSANAEMSNSLFADCPFATSDSYKEIIEKAEKLVNGGDKPKETTSTNLSTLFENIEISGAKKSAKPHFYPIKPINAENIFPKTEKTGSYQDLWQQFIQAIKAIPRSHRSNPELWLDHFDTALQIFAGNIPSKYAADISLYDYSKTATAFATALYLCQQSEDKDKDNAFLLIQGDFFGIQDFIFSGGSETNKKAAKILRGRSFQVSLFTELAALKVLQLCGLPSTSQIMNAAGKFLIVAPNTQAVKNSIENARKELNSWFVNNTYGLIGLGLAVKPANESDFATVHFQKLRDSLFTELEKIKLQRLDLLESTDSVQNIDYKHGVCRQNNHFPALTKYDPNIESSGLSQISLDQIEIGKKLATKHRIIISELKSGIYNDERTNSLRMDIFGYKVIFTEPENETGKFSRPIHQIVRFWDFELPKSVSASVWNGYARRYVNAYVPYVKENEIFIKEKYSAISDKLELKKNDIKPFDYIACEDRTPDLDSKKEEYKGQIALMTLKGDVDNLGEIFKISSANLAKMAALSRQMNQFFSLWLPAVCAEKFPNMYTVFAGGDDFFLIGPWLQTQRLAVKMQQEFAKYAASNEGIHFSAGMIMTKLGMPVPQMGELAEEALTEKAKKIMGKNAVTIYGLSVKWDDYKSLMALNDEISSLACNYKLSRSYLYSLINFSEEAKRADNHIESTIWRSRFYYKTVRDVIDKFKDSEKRHMALEELSKLFGDGIEKYKVAFKIPLFNYFYQIRK